jgi:hypothetical protein
MTVDPQVRQLLNQLTGTGATSEEVWRSCPELLAEVSARYRQTAGGVY